MTVYGANFGTRFEGQRVELDGTPATPEKQERSDTQFALKVPSALAGQAWPQSGKVVSLRVFVREMPSVNETKLTVQP